jgi:hypothetical protein
MEVNAGSTNHALHVLDNVLLVERKLRISKQLHKMSETYIF